MRKWRKLRDRLAGKHPRRAKLRQGVTFAQFERVCDLLGLNPDRLVQADEKETAALMEAIECPPLDRCAEICEIVLSNHAAFDLRNDFTRPQLSDFMATLCTSFFLNESRESFARLMTSVMRSRDGQKQNSPPMPAP